MDLAASFRAFTDDELLALLTARPELAERGPSTFVDLASRAVQANSLVSALTSLNTFEREVLDSLVHLDQPADAVDVAALPAVPGDPLLIEPVLGRLRILGLVTAVGNGGGRPCYEVLKEVRRLVPAPFVLHPRLEKLLDRYSVPDLRTMAINVGLPVKTVGKVGLIADLVSLLAAPDGPGEVLSRGSHEVEALLRAIHDDLYGMLPLDTRPWSRSTIPDAVGWLLGHGLLLPISSDTVVIAREVALALRGGAPIPAFSPVPPAVRLRRDRPGRTPVPAMVELTPNALIEAMSAIGTTWARTAPAPLRTDGVGVKEVRTLEKSLGIDENSVARLIELGGMAGLFASDLFGNRIGPTAAFDDWLAADSMARWCVLVYSWAQSTSSLGRVVRHPDGEKAEAPLSPVWDVDFDESWRKARVVEALGSVEPGNTVDLVSLAQRARWFSPDRWGPATNYLDAVVEILEEAALLGVVTGGCLTDLGRALFLDGTPDALDRASAKVFPAPVHTFTVSGDLSAIAPGELTSRVAGELGLVAELVSKGGASVYRFTEGSLRRALDHGRTTEEIHAFLRAHARPGVPQPLTYLVDDVGRRYGSVRVGSALSYIRADDPAVLAELLRSKKTAKLKLQQLAPTVAVTALASAKVVRGLRDAGFLPVEEGDHGVVVRPVQTPVGGGHRRPGRNAEHARTRAVWDALREIDRRGDSGPKVPSTVQALIHTIRAKG